MVLGRVIRAVDNVSSTVSDILLTYLGRGQCLCCPVDSCLVVQPGNGDLHLLSGVATGTCRSGRKRKVLIANESVSLRATTWRVVAEVGAR